MIVFLLTCLVVVVVFIVVRLVLDQIGLGDPINKIVLLIIGLIALFVLIDAALRALGRGGLGVV